MARGERASVEIDTALLYRGSIGLFYSICGGKFQDKGETVSVRSVLLVVLLFSNRKRVRYIHRHLDLSFMTQNKSSSL